MNAIDVIKTELACVQRDCCRVENQCAKCDLVLPVEEIISAYRKCINLLLGHEELKKENAELELKIKHLTKHLEPQSMTALFEQVEEEVKQEQRIKELEVQIEQMKKYLDCDFCEHQNNKDECHQCNYLEKTKWTLKRR